MKVIPKLSTRTVSAAERTLYRRFEDIQPPEPGSFCMHSLNLSEHAYKRMGELDFLLVTPSFLCVLEVKGGGVSTDGETWVSVDRYGDRHVLVQSPFEQAKSGMFSLTDRLRNEFEFRPVDRMVPGYAVVFPDSVFEKCSVQWSDDLIIDQRSCSSTEALEQAVARCARYWKSKEHGRASTPLSGDELRDLRNLLRPSFCLVPSLNATAGSLADHMEELTEEQYKRLDFVEGAERILVSGSAGSGKTFLACEIARRHEAEGKRVLVLVKSRVLAEHLRPRVPGVDVVAFDDAALLPAETPWDVLVVDEAQDVMNMSDLDAISRHVVGGLERGSWRFFYDANNQAGVGGDFDPEALDYLASLGALTPRIEENLRNTKQIVEQTQLMTDADMGVAIAGSGPPVTWEYYDTVADEAAQVITWITDLVDRQGVKPCDIAVLSALPWDESCMAHLGSKDAARFRRLDSAELPRPGLEKSIFCTIDLFKGMESQFAILVDLPYPVDLQPGYWYVGMTRPRAGLWIAMPSDAGRRD